MPPNNPKKQAPNFSDKLGMSLGGTAKINVDATTEIKPTGNQNRAQGRHTKTNNHSAAKTEPPKIKEPKVNNGPNEVDTTKLKIKSETSEPKAEMKVKSEEEVIHHSHGKDDLEVKDWTTDKAPTRKKP